MRILEVAHLALLVAHFVGLAALIGPYLLQLRSQQTPRLRLMLVGAIAQILTGNGLIAANRLQGLDVIEPKMVLKLAIVVLALGVLITAVAAQRRRGAEPPSIRPLFHVAGGLALAEIVVAVAWT